jgi:hypothetical protein
MSFKSRWPTTPMDKLRSFFGSSDYLNNKTALPPKTRFSIRYFLLVMRYFSYLEKWKVMSLE